MLNATLGNAAELIIAIVAFSQGKLELVKASITGSILGNLLLILGLSLLLGGIRNGIQRFDRQAAGVAASMMTLGVEAKLDNGEHHVARWSVRTAVGVLAISTLGLVFLSEFLVGAVEPFAEALGLSEFFIGIIIIPIVGNVAEHIVAVQMAIKNKMDLAITIAMGSSMQVALLVGPLLVFVSLLFGPELTLFFTVLEVVALALSVLIATIISVDGESNWLEGAQLLAVYAIIALGFFYLLANVPEAETLRMLLPGMG